MTEMPFRPLSDRERASVAYLLTDAIPDAGVLREQARTARARPACDCGCPSIELEPDRARSSPAPSFSGTFRPIAEAVTRRDGPAHPALMLLFVKDGWLHELELADMAGTKKAWELPDPSSWEPPIPSEPPPENV